MQTKGKVDHLLSVPASPVDEAVIHVESLEVQVLAPEALHGEAKSLELHVS